MLVSILAGLQFKPRFQCTIVEFILYQHQLIGLQGPHLKEKPEAEIQGNAKNLYFLRHFFSLCIEIGHMEKLKILKLGF